MKEETTIGDFIDKIRAINIGEATIFLMSWEETAPVFHGRDYRSKPLTPDFVTHLLNEIVLFTHFWLNDLRDKQRLFDLARNTMNDILETVNALAGNHVATGQTPQLP